MNQSNGFIYAFKQEGGSTLVPSKQYGVDKAGCVRLRQPKAPSREDKRRALGVIQRALNLCRLGRITRAQVEARANTVGYTTKPATA